MTGFFIHRTYNLLCMTQTFIISLTKFLKTVIGLWLNCISMQMNNDFFFLKKDKVKTLFKLIGWRLNSKNWLMSLSFPPNIEPRVKQWLTHYKEYLILGRFSKTNGKQSKTFASFNGTFFQTFLPYFSFAIEFWQSGNESKLYTKYILKTI